MGTLKIVKVAKGSSWYGDRSLIEGKVVGYRGIKVDGSGIHGFDCSFTLEDGQVVEHIRCSEVEIDNAKLVALKDMSIEAFCEATDNRDEWFCAGITCLIEHEVSEDDEQIWIEQLGDDFNREHPLFWQWLIDEGFIGEKEELKPCPLCGRDVKVYAAEDWYDDSSFSGFNVGCSALSGGCGCAVGHPKSKEGVVEKWNRRA